MYSIDRSDKSKESGRTSGFANKLVNERGSAMIIALLIMALLLGFTALAISRTNSETVASANDAAESRAFEAGHASLEVMTRNFNKIFDTKLDPDPEDLTRVESQTPPGFDDYSFQQEVVQTDKTESVVMTEGQFQGLTALRDGWQLNSTTINDRNRVQVTLSRRFMNNRIPIFQFGIFYDDDLEFHPGPRFDFGGRVHSNGSLFLAASTRLNFSSKVTARNEVFTDVQKNGRAWNSSWNDEVFIKDASGVYRQLEYNQGSALTSPVNGAPVSTNPLPTAYRNTDWQTSAARFQGNLLANQRPLELPLKLNSDISGTRLLLNELVKRGKSVGDLWNSGGDGDARNLEVVTETTKDDLITAKERYYNKTGFRVLLADEQRLLPGCAGVSAGTRCGVRLDGDADGLNPGAPAGVARGYEPRQMVDGYRATRVNGNRLYVSGKEVWIKIETVVYDPTTQVYNTKDITEDILSLGVTERAPVINNVFRITQNGYDTGNTDSRSIIKLQRFVINPPGATTGASIGNTTAAAAGATFITNRTDGGVTRNFVQPSTVPNAGNCSAVLGTAVNSGAFPNGLAASDELAHRKNAEIGTAGGTVECVVPFPIKFFDTREGLYNDTTATFNPGTHYGGRVPVAGVMTSVDIDIANLRRFWAGDFDANMPSGTVYAGSAGHPLRGKCNQVPAVDCDIPSSNGWVLYISDRRGDYDFDGKYDMEDVYGPNDGILQPGEDMQRTAGQLGFGTLQTDYGRETERYRCANNPCITANVQAVSPDIAAVFNHKYYRRAVRLINGKTLPGQYLSATPQASKGFTVASENGVYVLGNYNAENVTSYGTPTPSTDYRPNDDRNVPASVAADAVTILSNDWQDARSFTYAFSLADRVPSETYTRFAILTGDTLSSLEATPNQGGTDPRMSGGVHNFKRFLENWGANGGTRLNYAGSLINLFNSQVNNAPFKCCVNVYGAPNRNWVFDTAFLDINRIPPGTPFFQAIQITGFERRN